MFGRRMQRLPRSRSSSRSSSGSRSISASRSSREILQSKKKLKVHSGSQCRCRNKKYEERRKKYKTSHTDRSRRSRCRHTVRGGHRHERFARNESEESSDDWRHECSMKKGKEDNKLKQCDRSYRLASCNRSRCCCTTAHANSRSHSIGNNCLDVLVNRQEDEDLTRIYYKQKRKKLNFSCRTHHDYDFHSDDEYCKKCFGSTTSDFKSVFNGEQNFSFLLGQNCNDWQAYDIRSHHILNRGSGMERIPAFRRHNLVQEMNAETSKERTWSTHEPGSKHATAGGNKRDWLMLSLNRAKAASPNVKDCDRDDFKLSLPGYTQSGMSTVMQEIDLNVAIEEEDGVMRDSTSLQLPPPPSCYLEGPHVLYPLVPPLKELLDHEVITDTFRFEEGKNDAIVKQYANECSSAAVSCQVGGEIILLDSSEDEHTQIEDKNIEMIKFLKGPKLELICDKHTISYAEKDSAKSLEDCVPGGNDLAIKSKADRSSVFLQTAEGEVVDTDGTMCGHDDASTNSCLHDDVNRLLHGKDEERETIENGSADSVVLADDALTEKKGQNLRMFYENQKSDFSGLKARKKRIVQRPSVFLQEPVDIHENVVPETAIGGILIVQKAFLNKMVIAKPRMWDADILCDLCHKGPSLSLGEWYSWCCGSFLNKCCCPPELQMKLKLGMRKQKSNKVKKNEELTWSGKVHKMCALWSSEVFEEDEGDRLQGVLDAVRRGRSLTCAGCKDSGPTLGCRVKSCHRSYHYPCADRLASKLQCRMWDGVQFPVACHGHRHVVRSCPNAKEKGPDLKNWRKKGSIQRTKPNMSSESLSDTEQGILARADFYKNGRGETQGNSLQGPRLICPTLVDSEKKTDGPKSRVLVIDLSSDSENTNKEKLSSDVRCKADGLSFTKHASVKDFQKGDSIEAIANVDRLCNQGLGESRHEDATSTLYYMGNNLLCTDISGGHEEVTIPCTNDVDADPPPDIVYITQSRYLGSTRKILCNLLMDEENLARTCSGCNNFDIDDPHAVVSVHTSLKNCQRESDTRMDWQGQSMLGRLPYDRYGRLQLGPDNNDVIECNRRCPCGLNCLNKDLQKGLKIPLEVFKTKDRGWGVRTMKQIPRGKFVVEYVGEILTHREANERGMKYDLLHFSCLFSADHPEVSVDNRLVVDGFKMSNVARFINHSCEGNLRVYRVYTEVTDLRFCRIGMYSARDIEIGEELSYDYMYSNCRDMDKTDFEIDPTAIKCYCGSKKCRQWLWTGAA